MYMYDAGIVDQDVDASELFERLVDEVLGRFGLTHVVLDRKVAIAELLPLSLASFSRMSAITTHAPWSATASAMPKPMPRARA